MFDTVKVLPEVELLEVGSYQVKTFKPPQNEMYYIGIRGGCAYLCKDEALREVVPYNGDMLMLGEKYYTVSFEGGRLDDGREVEIK